MRPFIISFPELSALFQVIIIDLLLAADNIILISLVAAQMPVAQRKQVMILGILLGAVLRILFALIVTYLLTITGLLLLGGLLLLWVAWKMWRVLGQQVKHEQKIKKPKSFWEAVLLIVLADAAMSLDNVLAVAGAAHEHLWVLICGLALSVFFMAISANYISNMLEKYKFLAYGGVLIIFYVALSMIVEGGVEVWTQLFSANI